MTSTCATRICSPRTFPDFCYETGRRGRFLQTSVLPVYGWLSISWWITRARRARSAPACSPVRETYQLFSHLVDLCEIGVEDQASIDQLCVRGQLRNAIDIFGCEPCDGGKIQSGSEDSDVMAMLTASAVMVSTAARHQVHCP